MRTLACLVATVIAVALGATAPSHADTTRPAGTAVAAAAAPGPFGVRSTTTVHPCVGTRADGQNSQARRDGVFTPLQCTDAAPIGTGPGTGVNFYFPEVVGARPLIVFSGGYGANPGYFDRIARHWASHGYVVAVSYQLEELVPYSAFRGLRRAVEVDRDRSSPLFGRIDLRSVVLAGHSFGATNALHAADLIALRARGIDSPSGFTVPDGVRVVGVLAIGPAVGTVTDAVALPTLVVGGTRDFVAPPREIRRSYDAIHAGPAWWAILRDTAHLITLGPVASNPQAGIETAFLDHVTTGAYCSVFAGRDWPGDPRIVDAARNARALQERCPGTSGGAPTR
ncbi:MAG: hypothetical protein INR72_01735 [Williamsia herbipolensis]|uniref:Dienelactone hydrolase n=1 Tax=Williamsia serinedens TaxID=391736 RepID=A0ABT1H4H5_9NOCA|nr:hypothetical protein [Williamsia serinedens]MBE7159938.1 hypothetical protein [Williamsia herbipolensis]MCP2162086.1 putative dienelactone hydrolase [Williamsia serinedens]